MNTRYKWIRFLYAIVLVVTIAIPMGLDHAKAQNQLIDGAGYSITPEMPNKVPEVPEGKSYVEINNNIPYFTAKDISSTSSWVEFSELDELGRIGAANAILSVDLMPADQESRQDISDIKPTGWHQGKYNEVSGGWLYNRSHLIGFQLAGDGITELNLMTGTRWFNNDGMLPFENFVASTIENEEISVRYRITPYFEGGNLLASGAFMEGFSINDNGETLQFNIFVPNRQKNIVLDYGTGNHNAENITQTTMADPINQNHPGTKLYYSDSFGFASNNPNEIQAVRDSNSAAGVQPEEYAVTATTVVEEPVQQTVHYKNCTAVREAGVAPVYQGDPGYAPHLDRDNDGIGCE